ncbi:MAG: MFS transporter [Anaerolineae bacterium]
MSSSLWRDPDFIKLWVGQTVSEVGSHITGTGLPLIALLLAATPEQMGLLSALVALPVLLFGLFAGVWVDRLRRRPLMITADIGRCLILLSVPAAALTGHLSFELLCAVAVLSGVLSLLFNTAYHAALPALVERQRLLEANTRLATTSAAAEIGGPPLAGVLVQVLSAPLAMVLDALSFLVSALSLLLIRKEEPAPLPREQSQSVVTEIVEGLRVLWRQPILRTLTLVAVMDNFFGSFFAVLYSLYVVRDLGQSAFTLGVLVGAGGVGALVGSLLVGRLRWRLGHTLIGGRLIGSALGLLSLMVTGNFAVVALFLSQLIGDTAGSIYRVHEKSLQQGLVPDALLGRANASVNFLTQGIMPLGALVAGALAGVLGARVTLLLAVCGFSLAAVVLWLSPVRHLRSMGEVAGSG